MPTRTVVESLQLSGNQVTLALKPPFGEGATVVKSAEDPFQALFSAISAAVLELQAKRQKGHPQGKQELAEQEGNRGADPVRGEVSEVLLLRGSGSDSEESKAVVELGIKWKDPQREDENDRFEVSWHRDADSQRQLRQVAGVVVEKLSSRWVLN